MTVTAMAYYSIPALSRPPLYHASRPENGGFISQYIADVKEQVYAELKAQRASRAQKSAYNSYTRLPSYAEAAQSSPTKRSGESSRPSNPKIAFPTPQVAGHPVWPSSAKAAQHSSPPKRSSASSRPYKPNVSFPVAQVAPTPHWTSSTPAPSFPSPHVSVQSHHSRAWVPQVTPQPPKSIRFPTPQPYGPDTPITHPVEIPQPDLYSLDNRRTPRPYHVELPQPVQCSLEKVYFPYVYQDPALVVPFPSPFQSDSSPRSSYPTPSVFGSSNATTYGRSSRGPSRSSALSSPSRRKRGNYDSLRKAAENMELCRQEVAKWMSVMRQTRGEKLSDEERTVISLVKELDRRAASTLEQCLSLLSPVSTQSSIRFSTRLKSGALAADISQLATSATSLKHKLASLVRHLKDAKARGRKETPGFFTRVGNAIEDAPGCLAGLYLKNRLFRFGSLSKAHRMQYSDLDSDISTSLLPMSTLMRSLYSEVWRTYGVVLKSITNFESWLHAFRLELGRNALS